ncbi:hypothetical protein JW879_01375 [candidate division WOR-3 bacterium]|nr:hypothetical protein [candidate division WOR-3 bacterium]
MRKITLILTLLIVVFLAIPLYAGDEFVEQHCWGFENATYFKDAGDNTILPWEIYVRSFIGICPDSNQAKVLCPLDYAFYHAYNAAFAVAAGNCFGMSLLANIIYKEEGHMGFCKPVYTYSGDFDGPASAKLCTVITVMQCHEWSHAGIMWMAENITGTHIKDGNYAYEQVEYYLSMGDLPVLTIVQNTSLVGHTLIPYKVEESGSKRYIYIYDSNKWYPPDSLFYDDHDNYIEVTKSNGNWKYQWDASTTWGSPDGFIFATPMSIVKASSRNPLQLGGITDAMNHVFLTGANISQISDDEGHKFYKTSANSHNKLSDIEDNPSLKMKNLIRMPMTFAAPARSVRKTVRKPANPPEIYFAIGSEGKNLNFEIAATGKKYKFEMAGTDNIIRLSAPGGSSGRDNFEVTKLSTNNQELKLSSKRGTAKFEVELHQTVPGSETSRIFKVTNLQAPSSSPVRLRLAEGRDALLLIGEKGPVSCNLQITQVADGKITKMPARTLNVPGKEWQKVTPDNWNKLNGATIKVNKLQTQIPPDPLDKKQMPVDPIEKKK